MKTTPSNNKLVSVRIDKWLWAARFYKTRQLAVKALKNGKITLNDQLTKPAANINIGDQVVIKQAAYKRTIIIDALAEKRGSATIAQTLYHETKQSIIDREVLKQQLASQPKIDTDRHKPDKRALRSSRAFKRGDRS